MGATVGRFEPGRVAVIADSTACLPTELVEQHGLTIIPMQLVIGDQTLEEGVSVTAETVAQAFRERKSVTTSRPAPSTFLEAYRAAAHGGASGVVSVHVSSEVSGTYESAVVAARAAPVDVRVVDSRQVAMGTGFAVLAAVEAAAEGGDLDAVAIAAEKQAAATSVFFYVDTLEYLRRGGRIGSARSLLGSALLIKPLLQVEDGHIVPLEKVRTASKALTRMAEIAKSRAGDAEVDVAIHHFTDPERAEQLAETLREGIPQLRSLHILEIAAVLAAHVGPRALAVVISTH